MLNNNLSWINLNVGSGGGGTGGVSDYNDLANRPIKSLQGTSQNPISLWNLSTGLYLLNGYINYDANNSREGVNLFVSLTAQMQNGQYVMSAFVPSWEAHYEYKKASANTTDYTEHQMLKMLTQDEVLTMTNETPYTPTGDYNPSTKKYVDDSMNAVLEHLSELGVNEQDIQALITENRRRDIAIQALLNETADKNVTIEEETHTISLDYSIEDGMATVNKLEGSTLVNVSKQKEAIDITKSYDVETGNYIHLESEQDGKCKPLFEGNTAVNRAYGERNVVAMPKIESVGNNNHTITNGLDGGKVEVENVKGNTLVNVANGNYWFAGGATIKENNTIDRGYGFTIVSPGSCVIAKGSSVLKDNTKYTLVFDVNSNIGGLQYSYYDGITFTEGVEGFVDTTDYSNGYTRVITTRTTTTNCRDIVIGSHGEMSVDKYLNVKNLMIFEGDLTQTPELIPTEYIEGLKSSFEDKMVNLFNKATTQDGYEFDGINGEMVPNPAWFISDYIPVKPNTTYSKSGLAGTAIVFYNASKVKISVTNVSQQFLTPNDCCYVRINGYLAKKDTCQIEEGAAVTEYKPYGIHKAEVKTVGKNKIPYWERGYINSSNGIDDNSSQQLAISMRTGFIELDYTKRYVLSGLDSTYSMFFTFYDDNKKRIGRTNAVAVSSYTIFSGATLNANVILGYYKYVRITHYGGISDEFFKNNNIF